MQMVDERYFYCTLCDEVRERKAANFLFKTAFKETKSSTLAAGICLDHVVNASGTEPGCNNCLMK
jgi:hypothetical protein